MQALWRTLNSIVVFLLGFDAFCLNKKFLVLNMVSRNLKVKYRRSFFGFFWTVLNPIFLTAIYYLVFKKVFKVNQPNYIPFLLSGIFPWTFFSQTISECADSILSHHGLITKIPIPNNVFPFVVVSTNFLTLLFSTPLLFLTALVGGNSWSNTFLIVFPMFIFLFIIAYFIGLLNALVLVYFRDLKQAISLILQVWMYATPIFYSETMVPEKYRMLYYLNPIAGIFTALHNAFADQVWPESHHYIQSIVWILILGIITRIAYIRLNDTIIESI